VVWAVGLGLVPRRRWPDHFSMSAVNPDFVESSQMPSKTAPPKTFQLKITLLGVHPQIWRHIQIPITTRLCCLHDVIQVVMGWTDSHLHQFEKDGKFWSVPETDDYNMGIRDESRVAIDKLLQEEGDSASYLYDLGDKWRYTVYLEKILPSEASSARPICLAGERRCPPEDVGGPSGYEEFLAVIFEPGHEESERFRQWGGGKFHAEEFNLEAVNQVLEKMRWPARHPWQRSSIGRKSES
jgi:Plasmid pRiA4b ORF-3-like protein